MRKLVLVSALFFLLCSPAIAQIVQVPASGNQVCSGQVGGTATDCSLDPINTTGATLLLAYVADYVPGGTTGTLSDSKGNSYTALTSCANSQSRGLWYYSTSTTPTVGTNHYWSVSSSGTTYPTVFGIAFSGTNSSKFQAMSENCGSPGTGFALQPGSTTPSSNGSLVIVGMTGLFGVSGIGIDSSFTLADSIQASTGMPSAIGFLIQGTAGAVNPSWSWSSPSEQGTAPIAVFNAGSGGGGGGPVHGSHFLLGRRR